MMSFAQWGNALYSGEKSYAVVPNRKKFVGLAAAVLVIGFALVAIMGLNRSIEFTGGSQFDVTRVSDQSESFASRVVADTGLVEGHASRLRLRAYPDLVAGFCHHRPDARRPGGRVRR